MIPVHPTTCIGAVATATPPYTIRQPAAKEFIEKNYAEQLSTKSRAIMHKVYSHPSIHQRSVTFDNPEILMHEDTDARISRFEYWSVELATQASQNALKKAGISIKNVKGIVVNTCTGYICPGISTYLIEKLGLSQSTRAYDLVGSGCGGALPNLEVSLSTLNGDRDGVVLSIAVEICTATYQMGDDLSLIISNALFGDGAAAAVIWRRDEGLEVVDSASLYVPAQREAVRYVYKNGDLHNQLSSRLPKMVSDAAGKVVGELLKRHSLKIPDLKYWAIHTGGDKILTAIKNELELTEDQLKPTREILTNYGNMSSPTVWFVLDEIVQNGIKKNDWVVGIAFGAGLSVHAVLLRKK